MVPNPRSPKLGDGRSTHSAILSGHLNEDKVKVAIIKNALFSQCYQFMCIMLGCSVNSMGNLNMDCLQGPEMSLKESIVWFCWVLV